MYAVIRTGGKQYTVKPGDVLHVEKLEQKLGSEVTISDVLLVGGDKVHVGQPLVKDAAVTIVITKQARTRKLIVFKKKRRHSYRKFKTHKQDFTEIFVKAITMAGKTEKANTEPQVKDMAAIRLQRIEDKVAARQERVSKTGEDREEAAPKVAKSAKKKVTKKAGAKKSVKKASAKKKTAKKTAKK
jgi:large subunit ribosomal protein L21